MIKLIEFDALKEIVDNRGDKKVVFTNGCFDILHVGHVRFLEECKKEGDILIVALNNDVSVRKIKGICRPILPFEQRAEILSSMVWVDYIIGFEDETPFGLIKFFSPDILVKGADWDESRIVGADYINSKGGKVVRVNFTCFTSSSQIIYSILRKFGKEGNCILNGDNPQ
jgi:D-glycero-beta-D-manno-heptose 1-phosphate adenylyltransferase